MHSSTVMLTALCIIILIPNVLAAADGSKSIAFDSYDQSENYLFCFARKTSRESETNGM